MPLLQALCARLGDYPAQENPSKQAQTTRNMLSASAACSRRAWPELLHSCLLLAACPGPEMRKALEARLGAYPAQARLNRHMARATLPAAAAAVLAAEPALAAPAVAAFYERDVQDMAAAAHQRRFPPEVNMAMPCLPKHV